MEKTNKSLKENQKKAIKQVKETIQDLKIKIEVIKHKPREFWIWKIWADEQELQRSIANKMQEMEERISGAEDTVEEIDSLVK